MKIAIKIFLQNKHYHQSLYFFTEKTDILEKFLLIKFFELN